MKLVTTLSIILGMMILAFSLNSQSYRCGTDQSDAFMQDLIRNKKDWPNIIQKGAVERFIPVQFHLVADNDGGGRASEKAVLQALCILNERYDSLEMRFYLADDMRNINNTLINNNPGHFNSTVTMRNLKNQEAMNVFVLEAPGEGVAGYYTREPNDFIVMGKRFLANEGYTLEHEVGHFFTLSHTHRGWEDNPYDPEIHGDTVLITTVGSSQSNTVGVELVDGSNCGNLGWADPLAGDGICDTPPDYGFGQSCNCCFMSWEVYDRNGDLIEPMLNNVMSYSQNCGEFDFTQQQVFALKTSFDSGRRSYIRTNEVTEYTPITDPATLVRPANQEMIEDFNGVHLEWEPVPNAEEYIITINGTVSQTYRTTDTLIYLAELKPNGNYLWDVQPTNKFGSGCVPKDARLFFTGSSMTAVIDHPFVNEINVYPNPVSGMSRLYININNSQAMDVKARILSLKGQTVQETKTRPLTAGDNNFQITLGDMPAGIYLLEIIATEGRILEKIIIE